MSTLFVFTSHWDLYLKGSCTWIFKISTSHSSTYGRKWCWTWTHISHIHLSWSLIEKVPIKLSSIVYSLFNLLTSLHGSMWRWALLHCQHIQLVWSQISESAYRIVLHCICIFNLGTVQHMERKWRWVLAHWFAHPPLMESLMTLPTIHKQWTPMHA